MKKRILSLFIVFAMTVSLIPMTASANTPVSMHEIPNYVIRGDFTIGFFNFVDGRATHLEVRLNRDIYTGERIIIPVEEAMDYFVELIGLESIRDILIRSFEQHGITEFNTFAKIEINKEYSLSGLTRIRAMNICDDVLDGIATDVMTHNRTGIGGWLINDYGFTAGETIIRAQVDGTGTVTFGAGVFQIQDGENLFEVDLNGVILTNVDFRCCFGRCLMAAVGDVNNDGVVTIDDALEILKYLAGIRGRINNNGIALNHALILPSSREAGEPSIGDALEIIKALAGLPSVVTRLSR
jgi:hypothetical protein